MDQCVYNNTMENATIVTSIPKQSAPVDEAPSQFSVNVGAIRNLGLTQGVIGLLTIIFGVGATVRLDENYWLNKSGNGIWGGVWILLNGGIGVVSALYQNSRKLNGINLAFCVASCLVAFISCCLLANGLRLSHNCVPHSSYNLYSNYTYQHRYEDTYCHDSRHVVTYIYGIWLSLMIVEFFVAFVTAICCEDARKCWSGRVNGGSSSEQSMASSNEPTDTTISGDPENNCDMEPDLYGDAQQAMM